MKAVRPKNSKKSTTDLSLPSSAVLDDLDRRILTRYQTNTRVTASSIGEVIGLSAAAVQRRIKRMREQGIITNEIAQIDASAVGLPVTVVVHIDQLQGLTFEINVQQCWYTTGLSDFILIVRVASMAAYEQFSRNVLLSNKNVARFTSYVALVEVKSGFALPI
jgi:Lrp/AsnC family transcriptional regulator, leucine-responsive regulatory protein